MPAYGFDDNKNLIGVYSTTESDSKIAPRSKLNTNAYNLQQLASKTYNLGLATLSALTSIKNGGTITDTQINNINSALSDIASVEHAVITTY